MAISPATLEIWERDMGDFARDADYWARRLQRAINEIRDQRRELTAAVAKIIELEAEIVRLTHSDPLSHP